MNFLLQSHLPTSLLMVVLLEPFLADQKEDQVLLELGLLVCWVLLLQWLVSWGLVWLVQVCLALVCWVLLHHTALV